jgi:DNA-binding transcriptional LysR family regulator
MYDTRGAALTECPLIDVGADLPYISSYLSQVFESRPALDAAVVLPDLRGVLELITAGLGIGVLPRHMCAAEMAAGRIRVLYDPESAPLRTLFAAVRTGATAKPHVAAAHRQLVANARTW